MNHYFTARYAMLMAALLTLSQAFAQPVKYQWDEGRKRAVLTDDEANQNELIIRHHLQYDYEVENDQLVLYSTLHRIVRVNSNEAIQRHNRIYVSLARTLELVDVKARAINKAGVVTVLDQSSLKEVKDDEASDSYRIFAMEGLELGSEIEYYYTKKMRGNPFDRAFLQFDAPVRKASFRLSSPSHLEWAFKGYNGCPTPVLNKQERNVYEVTYENVPRHKTEEFASKNANRARIDFKLAYNTARSKARMYTWEDAAKRMYNNVATRTKDEDKAVEKWIKNKNITGDLPQRIAEWEKQVKTTIGLSEQNSENLSDIAEIVKNGLASKFGMTRMLLAVYQSAGINCQLALTCSRDDVRFDKEFDSWAFLDVYLLYFPDTRQYLAPNSFEMRYPLVPPEYTDQYGLHIEAVEVGGLKSALGTVEWIPALPYTSNMDNLDIRVTFNEGNTSNTIWLKRDFGGHNAAFLCAYYDAMASQQKTELVRSLIQQTAPDVEPAKWRAGNTPGQDIRFTLETEFSSDHFLELAGKKILFKIGELIGPQVEMYRDNERTQPIENEYNRGYYRVIKVKLPDYYSVKNTEKLKMHYMYDNSEKTPFVFKSNFIQSGKELVVTIEEYYMNISVPLERYEDFRKIINAAADFNKVTLVLEPEER